MTSRSNSLTPALSLKRERETRPNPRPQRGRGQGEGAGAGFSLIELVIVMAILGIATALVSPAIPRSLDGWRLRTAARQLVALMRYAQSQALATKEPVSVVLDRAAGRGGISTGEDPVRWRVTLPLGVRFLWSGDEPTAAFTFEPWGSSTGGSVDVVNRLSQIFRIVVDAATGRVRLETPQADEARRT